tara:strand:- start:494 stop:913 length:420 start_codon:yes stop_codon:yes gene_type:complete
MRYQGKYNVSFPRKYKGDSNNVIYRSSWEYKFMKWCDLTPSIQEWGSEEIIIPYISPVDGKRHRYFPDFYVKIANRKYLVEVKPMKQTKEPKTQKRVTKKYISEVTTWAVNKAKWKAAEEFCLDQGWEFKIITEKELKV